MLNRNQEDLTRVAVSGTVWLLGSSVVIQASSLLAQFALGWFLSDDDFGLYALAIGVTSCLLAFRDGGVSLWLARQARSDFDRNVYQGFWLCFLGSVTVGAVLILIAPLAAWAYAEPRIVPLMLVVAISLPLDAYGVISEVDLQVGLRFRDLAFFRTVSPIFRYGAAIVFAWQGMGPLSFVLPLVLVALIRMVQGYALTRFSPWQIRIDWRHVRSIFSKSRWVYGGTFASSVFRQIDYLVLGLVVSTATVGVYFFAFQLAVQPVLLFGQSLRRVLIPTISRAGDDRSRRQRAVIRASASIGLIASGLFMLLVLLAEPMEALLWRGRWSTAVPAIQCLAAVMPLHLFALLTRMIAQSDGRFRLWGSVICLRSVGLGVTAFAAGSYWGDQPRFIAVAVAAYMAISSVAEAALILRCADLLVRPVFSMVLPPYVFTLLLAFACSYLPALVPWSPGSESLASISSILSAVIFVGLFMTGSFAVFRVHVDHLSALRRAVL